MSKKIIYSFLGLPASGKGTQAEILAKKDNIEVVGIGDLIRQTIEEGGAKDPFVHAIENRYDKGVPQPDDVVIDLVAKYLERNTKDEIILDNFPFNQKQADFLLGLKNNYNFVLIYIKISPETTIKRIVSRRVCADCGAIYDSADEMICEKCGGSLVVRADDNEETVKKRISLYLPRIEEVEKFYHEHNLKVIELDGEKSIDEVDKELWQKIQTF